MNLVTAFWLLFAGSALLGGVALLLSLRLLLFKESQSSRQKSPREYFPGPKSESETLSPESFVSKPTLVTTSGKDTEKKTA